MLRCTNEEETISLADQKEVNVNYLQGPAKAGQQHMMWEDPILGVAKWPLTCARIHRKVMACFRVTKSGAAPERPGFESHCARTPLAARHSHSPKTLLSLSKQTLREKVSAFNIRGISFFRSLLLSVTLKMSSYVVLQQTETTGG